MKYFYRLRPMRQEEETYLKEMLFEAIYLPEPLKKQLSREILLHPDLIVYYENWGHNGDIAIVAEHIINNVLLACVWGRLFSPDRKGFGFVDENTPEISIAVRSGFKNKGIGTKLLRKILKEYQRAGFKKVSLSVSKQNPSVDLYIREGFKVYIENEEDYIMIFNLNKLSRKKHMP